VLQVGRLKNAARVLQLDLAQVLGQAVHIITELFGDLVANSPDLVDQGMNGFLSGVAMSCLPEKYT
jgi:hypothetical protein